MTDTSGRRRPKQQSFLVTYPDGTRKTVKLVGRQRQMLLELVKAGRRGVTAAEISSWALRASHYVLCLRREVGLNIVTLREPHGGDFAGWHGRYVLLTPVQPLEDEPEQVAA